MKPFKVTNRQSALINKKYARKRKVINGTVDAMEAVMKEAVDYIMDHWDGTDRFPVPTLNSMYLVSERFYRNVITEAIEHCEEEKIADSGKKVDGTGKKHLAKLPMGIPRNLKGMERIFRDRRSWPKVMKRSRIITDRLRRQYQEKLRAKFEEIVPQMRDGTITPMEAKKEMVKSWHASKARVETIFRTETTNYFGKAQVSFFESDPEIIGFLFDSLKDSGSTDICRTRHGLVYKPGTKLLTENTPALHWNCRSHLIPLANTPENRRMVSDPSRDPSKRSVAPLPKNWRK